MTKKARVHGEITRYAYASTAATGVYSGTAASKIGIVVRTWPRSEPVRRIETVAAPSVRSQKTSVRDAATTTSRIAVNESALDAPAAQAAMPAAPQTKARVDVQTTHRMWGVPNWLTRLIAPTHIAAIGPKRDAARMNGRNETLIS